MTSAWDRVKAAYLRISELAEDERRRALEDLERDDPEIVGEVRGLLAQREDDQFLQPPSEDQWKARIQGQRIAHFTLLEELGRGGMGTVYRARDEELAREVALKVLPPYRSNGQQGADRFLREARAVAKLRHPNIIRIHQVAQLDGERFFSMDLVRGHDLDRELALQRGELAQGGGQPFLPPFAETGYVRAVSELVARLADALQHAHEHGVVHRDVKPHNVLLEPDGTPVLADFGLAKDVDLGTLSRSSEVMGTPYYMSPEQARVTKRPVDHRTDVYSLGVVLYELLTLSRPFQGKTSHAVLSQIATREPAAIRMRNRRVPRDLETVCAQAMRKDPAQRYATAGAFAADLRRFLANESVAARPLGPLERAQRWTRAHPLATSAMLALLAGGPLLWWAGGAAVAAAEREALVARLPALERLAELPGASSEEALRELSDGAAAVAALRERNPQHPAIAPREAAIRAAALRVAGDLQREITAAASVGWIQDHTTLAALVDLYLDAWTLAGEPGGGSPEEVVLRLLGPPLSVTTVPPGAQVELRALDPATGLPLRDREPKRLGESPLEEVPIPFGSWMLVARAADGRYAEFVVHASNSSGAIRVPPLTLRDTDTVTAGMVLVPAGPMVGENEDEDYPLLRGKVDLHAFWVSPYEVTAGEYHEFCVATGRPMPDHWPDEWRAEWSNLPIAFVTLFEAEAFAAWQGTRLLVYPEWDRAARGVESRAWPWEAGGEPKLLASIERKEEGEPEQDSPDWIPGEDWDGQFEHYLVRCEPVGSYPRDSWPPGSSDARVFDVAGGVAEWTASPSFVQRSAGEWALDPTSRFTVGSGWGYPLFDLPTRVPTPLQANHMSVGFRTAKGVYD